MGWRLLEASTRSTVWPREQVSGPPHKYHADAHTGSRTNIWRNLSARARHKRHAEGKPQAKATHATKNEQ